MNQQVSEGLPIPYWEFIVILAAIILGTALIVFLIVKITHHIKVKNSEKAVDQKIESTASLLSTSFGGKDNIKEITTRGSRVTVLLNDPSKVDKQTIDKNLSSVMYMGNKIVFIIGEKSEDFEKMLSENIDKLSK